MKKLLYVLGALIVISVVAFFVLASQLGAIVKANVNRYGPKYTQSKVELADAKISPFSGKGTLKNLVIGNPQGWSDANAFTLSEITLDVEPRSLTGEHVVINRILIDHPEINFESKLTSSNLQDLLKNIQQSAGHSSGSDQAKSKDGKPIKIELKDFTLQNAKLIASAADKTVTVEMPTLHLQDLGSKEGGLTPEELSVAIFKAVSAQALQAGAKAALEKGVLEKAGLKGAEGLLRALGGQTQPTPNPTPKP